MWTNITLEVSLVNKLTYLKKRLNNNRQIRQQYYSNVFYVIP